MSWPLASFALVALVLGVGWLAYERSRPSARTVALVATLSALAALGRDAFAALDEVKPITAMTFVVGYCLGPLPGFVVGAIGMLASNMLLGQGPYTPWQMAAWGIVGLLGAAAGRLSRRRLRRLPLALGCAFAAVIAKEIMNLYEWTIGALYTPAALLAVAGRSLPFDVVDVVSTLLFGLAFGPELARLLERMRARTTIEWQRAGATLPVALALLAAAGLAGAQAARASSADLAGQGAASPAHAAASASSALSRGVSYLLSAQKPDGGFGAQRGSPSTAMYSGWAAIGLAAAGQRPSQVRRDGHSVLDALRARATAAKGAGDVERTILALHACGLPAGTLAKYDLGVRLASFRQPDGSFSGQVNLTAFGIFALRALGRGTADSEIHAAGAWLLRQQNGDGGFSFATKGDPSDVDDTAAAVQGLAATGLRGGRPLARAGAFLRHVENRDGGFPLQPGGESNAQSTAWAIQGLLAAKTSPAGRGRSPIAYLESLAAPDGSIRYARGVEQTPVWVTAETIAALAGHPFPIAAPSGRGARVAGGAQGGSASVETGSGTPPRGAVARGIGSARSGNGHARQGAISSAAANGGLPVAAAPAAVRALLAADAIARRCAEALRA